MFCFQGILIFASVICKICFGLVNLGSSLFGLPKLFQRQSTQKMVFIRIRSLYGLDSSLQLKKTLFYLSYHIDFKDRLKRRMMISSNLSFFERKNISSNAFKSIDLRVLSKVVYIKKFTSYIRSLSHSTLPSEFSGAAMCGWNIFKAESKNTLEQNQFWINGRRTHMGHIHGHDNHESHEKLGAYGEKVLRWGLWSDIILTFGKVAAGYVSSSNAIIADAAHSASDIVLSGVALWSSKASKAPPDQEHPYGYWKIESMGALGISTLLLVTGSGIAWNALDVLQVLVPAMLGGQDTIVQATTDTVIHQDVHNHGHRHEHGFVGHKHVFDMEHMQVALIAAIVGIGAKEALYLITKAAAEKSGSALLKANAWHHRGDAISTIVALIGVGGAMMGMPLLDPMAALLVSGMIIKAGLETGYQSMQELLDKGLPQSILKPIHKSILQVNGVKSIPQLKGRRMGSIVHIDVHIEVDPCISVSAARDIGESARQQVQTHHPNITDSFIYIDLADGRPSLSAPTGMVLNTVAKDKHFHHGHNQDEHTHEHEHEHFHGHSDIKQPHSHLHGCDYKDHHDKHSHRQQHDHEQTKRVGTELKEEDESSKDLKKIKPNAELLPSNDPMSKDGHKIFYNNVDTLRQIEVKRIVHQVLQANFYKVVKVKVVTCHLLQGKVVVDIGISLNPNLSIRDAMRHANDMETCLLQNVEDLAVVNMQLNLRSG